LPVNKGFIVYTRSNNHLEELAITDALKKKDIILVDEIFKIINLEYYPKGSNSKVKCSDCTYRNICVA